MTSNSVIAICAVAGAILFGISGTAQSSSEPLPIDTLPRFATPHFNFVVVVVANFDRAFRFYTQALGMHERGRAQPDLKNFEVIVGYDDNPLTPGISVKYRNGVTNPRGNGSSAINLVVKDLAAIVGRVQQHGGTIVLPPVRGVASKNSYSFAIVEDPDGNTIELVEYHQIEKP